MYLKLVPSLRGWWLPSMGEKHPLWVVNSLCVVIPFLGIGLVNRKRLVTTRERSFQTKMVVNDFENLYENVKSYFDSILIFFKKYFDQNIIYDLS